MIQFRLKEKIEKENSRVAKKTKKEKNNNKKQKLKDLDLFIIILKKIGQMLEKRQDRLILTLQQLLKR